MEIAAQLEQTGIPVWIDRTGISAGSGWAEEIVAAVRRCSGLVVLCSSAAIGSRNVRQELQLAWDNDRPILPVLLEPVEFPDAVSYDHLVGGVERAYSDPYYARRVDRDHIRRALHLLRTTASSTQLTFSVS